MSHPSDPTPTELPGTGPAAWHSSPTARQAWLSVPVFLCAVLALWLALLALYAYQNTAVMRESMQKQALTQQQISSLYQIKSALAEAESAVDAYRLTGEAKYVQAHDRAVNQIAALWPALRRTDAQTPWSPQTLQVLAIATQERLAGLGQAIATRQTQGNTPGQQSLPDHGGGEGRAAIQAQIEQRQDEAMHFLEARVTEGEQKSNAVIHAGGLGFLLSTALLTLIFFALRLRHSEATLAKAQTIAHLGSWERDLGSGITERRRTEEERDRYITLVKNSADFIGMCDLKGVPFFVNDAGLKMLGLDGPEDLTKIVVGDCFFPEDQPFIMEQFLPSTLDGPAEIEIRFRHFKTGAAVWMIYSVFALRDADGRPTGFATVSRNITERKRMEQALLASEQFKQGMLDSLPAHVAVLDDAGTILAVNRPWLRFAEQNGSPEAAGLAVGTNYLEVCRNAVRNGEPVAETVLQGLESVLSGAKPLFELEYPCDLPNEKRWYVAHILKPAANIGGAIITHLDITERKLAEEALLETQRQNAFLANILENSSQPFGLGYPDGHMDLTNQAFQALLGFSAEELVDIDWAATLTPHEWREIEAEKIAELDRIDGPVRYEKEYWRKDGSRVPVELLVNGVKDEAGKPDYYYAFVTDISERKRSEDALRQERQFLRQVIDAVPSLIFVKDQEGRILLCNEAFAGEYGCCVDDLVGKANGEFNLDADEVAQFYRDDREVIATGHPKIIGEEKATHADGTVHWYSTAKLPMRNAAGQCDRVLGVATDITARKQAEEALRHSQADLNRAQAVAHTGSWRLDVRKNRLTWSDENHRIFDIGKDAPLNYEAFLAAIHPDDRNYVDAAWQAALAGKPYDIEHRIIVGERIKWVRERAELEFDETGTLLGGFGTTQDISELKSSQKALQQERSFLRQVLDATPSIIFVKDREGRFILGNEALAQGYGSTTAALLGMRDADFNPNAEEVAQFLRNDREVLDSGKPKLFPLERVTLVDGTAHWFSTMKVPLPEADGSCVKLLGVATDITERKRAEEALQEADRRKDEFLAMLAHELRNPLTPIMVAAQMLQNRGTPDPALMKWAGDTVKHQCENLTQLVNQLLDVSRVTKGKVTLQKKPLDLRDLLRRAVESCKPNIAQHRHELTLADMPEPVPVKADAVRIEQVIGNLLNNAAKYTPDGGSIRVSLVREDAAAVIRVRDNGIGISAAMLPSVFDLFVQAERTLDRAQGGLGIGLALVKSLIELHGGSTSAKSAGIGAGSEFEVRLPLMVEAMEPCAVPKATAQTPAKSRRVLVVDDNEDVRVSMAMLLRAMGHQVWEAEGGQEALALPGLADLDAVLMDIGMPGLNGYEVARLLRQDPAFDAVILIAMTGYSQEYDRQESLRAGFKHHLVKPFDPAVFADILAEID